MILVRRVLAGIVLFICIALCVYLFLPKPELVTYQAWSSAWYDRNGTLLHLDLADDERYRLQTKLKDVSPKLIEATLLYEDKNYYHHPGVDPIAIVRAFMQTYIFRGRRIGASTITMQVARLRWNIDSSTFSGKCQQIFRALQLVRHYNKSEVLEAYFNLAPYGGNVEGIAAASRIYFDKAAADLSLPEALTLAVVPQNPNRRNPASRKGYHSLLSARRDLFHRWVEQHPQDADKASLLSMPLEIRKLNDMPLRAPHFVNWLREKKPNWKSGEFRSTLDIRKQKVLEDTLSAYVKRKRDIGIHNGAMLLLNYKTMDIEAMVGSADFFNADIQGQVNGTLAKRSPGSTLKPLLYALAFDQGLIHPMSLMHDSPRRFSAFTPENFDKKFMGPLLAGDALALSRNLPAVELSAQVHDPDLYEFLKSAEVAGLRDKSYYGLALALGGAELSMLELSQLYAVLANNGVWRPARTLLDDSAQPNTLPDAGKKLLSPEADFMVLDILRGIPAPGQSHYIDSAQRNEVAWKTGTSWAFRDAWAIGISGPYVLAVWIGNFDGESNNAFVGRGAAGPLLFAALSRIQSQSHWTLEQLYPPERLKLRKIDMCADTGDLPGRFCPRTKKGWFIPGVSPIKVETVYRQIPIDNASGLRSCHLNGENTTSRVYAFWPSDFAGIFKQAGISLRTPPPYDPSCSLDERNPSGVAPKIVSPQSTLRYVIAHAGKTPTSMEIPFSATADADAGNLYWFLGKEYLGKVKNGETLYWQARPGQYHIKVVDDMGRSTGAMLHVAEEDH